MEKATKRRAIKKKIENGKDPFNEKPTTKKPPKKEKNLKSKEKALKWAMEKFGTTLLSADQKKEANQKARDDKDTIPFPDDKDTGTPIGRRAAHNEANDEMIRRHFGALNISPDDYDRALKIYEGDHDAAMDSLMMKSQEAKEHANAKYKNWICAAGPVETTPDSINVDGILEISDISEKSRSRNTTPVVVKSRHETVTKTRAEGKAEPKPKPKHTEITQDERKREWKHALELRDKLPVVWADLSEEVQKEAENSIADALVMARRRARLTNEEYLKAVLGK